MPAKSGLVWFLVLREHAEACSGAQIQQRLNDIRCAFCRVDLQCAGPRRAVLTGGASCSRQVTVASSVSVRARCCVVLHFCCVRCCSPVARRAHFRCDAAAFRARPVCSSKWRLYTSDAWRLRLLDPQHIADAAIQFSVGRCGLDRQCFQCVAACALERPIRRAELSPDHAPRRASARSSHTDGCLHHRVAACRAGCAVSGFRACCGCVGSLRWHARFCGRC